MSPRRVAVDVANDSVYVVNVGGNTVSVVNSASCNATTTRGCPAAPADGRGGGLARIGAGALRSTCGPIETQQASGQPAAVFTSQATKVASGSVGGKGWTLWVRKGLPEPRALEDGGVVLGGRWYGLCAGFANVAEMEFIDAGRNGIAYGYMAMPGKLSLTMAPSSSLRTPDTVALGSGSFFIGSLAKPACAYKSVVLHAVTQGSSAMHQLGFGSCEANRDVTITGSDGEWGTGQAAASAPGMGLDASAPGSGGPGALVNTADDCSSRATTSESGGGAAARTVTETRVAHGLVGARPWSLWSASKGSGVDAIENGGLVVGGRWYGMCPGPPNPGEFELLSTGSDGIVFGYIANPGNYKVMLSGAPDLRSPATYRVDGGTFFIGMLPRSACAYRALQLTAATAGVTDLHHLGFGRCRPDQLVAITESNGSW